MYDQRVIVKKKKVHGHSHHGGSWKVAYADFVTAMMAFFMVMWILGMSEQDRSIIAAYFNDPIGFSTNQPRTKVNLTTAISSTVTVQQGDKSSAGEDRNKDEVDRMKSVAGDIKAQTKKDGSLTGLSDQVQVALTRDGLQIELVEKKHSTFFDSGKATLRPEGRKLIERIGPILAKTGRKITIQGHTDAMPYGGSGYTNWELSLDRAASVRRALCLAGVKESQIEGVHGYAATRLKDPQNPLSDDNRRVTILLPFEKGGSALPKDELEAQKPGLAPKRIRF